MSEPRTAVRAYPHYRDSGVEWLGSMPRHWQAVRLEHVASYRTSSVDKKSVDGEIPVRLCNYTDVYYNDHIRACDGPFMAATASAREIASFGLVVGDVLITKDSEDWEDIGVPALIRETAADFVCGYHLGIIRCSPTVDSGFMFRAIQSEAVNCQMQISASGVTRYGLPNSAVTDLELPLPPLAEQRAIAGFLDRETERIDGLVEKKRLLIERLEEYRTALITRTVTRGLPPEAARAAGLDPSP
ncbi:MAG: restriction endonuclease subunit S, partial [Chloroflexi bacterium]|nr:restriction endonuclease subunit S [Chloroflexota bacterium]